MPFKTSDVNKHNKGLSDKQKKQWVGIANSALDRCLKEGKSLEECDGYAIKIANGVIKKQNEAAIDCLLGTIQQSQELCAEVVDGWYYEFFPSESTKVVENVTIDNQSIQFLDSESHVLQIEESTLLASEDEEPSVTTDTDIDDTHLATFRALQGKHGEHSGISLNKVFYSAKVAEDLAPLLQKQRKMYLDHKLPDKFGRSSFEMAGIIVEAWAEKGASFVKTDVLTENPNTGFIWNIIKKYPTEIGVSINTLVEGRKAKIGEEEVFVVEKWRKLFSLDYVANPSAGGTLVNSENQIEEGELADELERAKRKFSLREIPWLVMELIFNAAIDRNIDEAARRKKVKDLVKEFSEELEKIDPVELYKDQVEKGGYLYANVDPVLAATDFDMVLAEACFDQEIMEVEFEEVTLDEFLIDDSLNQNKFSKESWESVNWNSLPASAFFVVIDENDRNTWHLPYCDLSGAVNKQALENIATIIKSRSIQLPKNIKEQMADWMKKAGLTIKQEVPIVDVEELKGLTIEQILLANPAVQEMKASFEQQIVDKDQKITTLQNDFDTQKKQLEESSKTLDELQLRDSERTRRELVDRLIGESEILDSKIEGHISEGFRANLLKTASEGEDAVKQAISDRELLITAERKRQQPIVQGNGQRPAGDPPDNGNTSHKVFEGVPIVESASPEALAANLRAS